MASCFAIFRQQSENAGADLPGGGADSYGDTSYEATPHGTRQLEGIEPGMEIIGRPGEELKGFSPPTPNPEFFEHMHQQISYIGANLDLSPAQVILDFTNENFVGYRGALHEARKGINRRQGMLVKRLHSPAYRFKVAQWMSADPALGRRRRKRIDPMRHMWQPPAFDYLEPINDAKGDLIQCQNSLISRRRLFAQRGMDWETVAAEIVADNALAMELAQARSDEFNAKHPKAETTWKDFMPLPTPDGVQGSLDANRQQPGAADAKPSA